MNYSVSYTKSNETCNPLFEKMRERFCADGTLAERMAIEAGLCKKRSKKSLAGVLCAEESEKKARISLKSFFSLKALGTVSMSVLIAGILFFSGASLEGVHTNMTASESAYDAYIVSESEHGALYFANECLPEVL